MEFVTLAENLKARMDDGGILTLVVDTNHVAVKAGTELRAAAGGKPAKTASRDIIARTKGWTGITMPFAAKAGGINIGVTVTAADAEDVIEARKRFEVEAAAAAATAAQKRAEEAEAREAALLARLAELEAKVGHPLTAQSAAMGEAAAQTAPNGGTDGGTDAPKGTDAPSAGDNAEFGTAAATAAAEKRRNTRRGGQ